MLRLYMNPSYSLVFHFVFGVLCFLITLLQLKMMVLSLQIWKGHLLLQVCLEHLLASFSCYHGHSYSAIQISH